MGEQKMKKLLGFFLAVSILFVFNNNAYCAGALKFEKNDVSIQLYGQINRAVLFTYDGDGSDTYHVDNDNSSTRIGAKIKANPAVAEGLTVGANLEFEYESNASNKVSQINSDPNDDDFVKRKIEAFVEGKYGKLTLGHGPTASDGTTEVDLSGTKVVSYSRVAAFAGGSLFYDETADALSGTSISSVFNNMDGYARKDRIRYDSPKFSNFQVAVSTTAENGDDAEDIAVRYKNKFGSTKVSAAVSFVNFRSSNSLDNQFSGSVSCLFDSGFNVTLAAGMRDFDASGRDEAIFYFGKLGYIAKLTPIGTTAFSIDYGQYDDIKVENDEANTVGVMVVQKLKKWNTEIYAGFRHHELDRNGADFDDILAGMAGLRVKFY